MHCLMQCALEKDEYQVRYKSKLFAKFYNMIQPLGKLSEM